MKKIISFLLFALCPLMTGSGGNVPSSGAVALTGELIATRSTVK